MIADIIFYLDGYLSGRAALISTADFTYYERRAEAELSALTLHKIDSAEVTENIRRCVCEVMEYLYRLDKRVDIKSENNDGYSVTYTEETKADRIYDIAKMYLPHKLLYRGCL
ncbi:MAG: hypothetical protein RR263_05010 [Oscillospiraceae bacterium]